MYFCTRFENLATKNMKLFKNLFTTILVLFTVIVLSAQESPVKWTYKTVKVNDSVAELQLRATIQPGYHLYAQSTKGIEQPVSFTFNPDATKYKKLGKVSEPTPQELTDEYGTARFFNNNVTFKQRIKVLDNQPFTIKGKVEGQACIEGKCTHIEDKFNFEIKGFDKVKVSENSLSEEEVEEEDTMAKAQPTTDIKAVIPTEEQSADKSDEEEDSLIKYFFIAILGGLAGLLMPCVFPMIPMTVSFFSKDGHAGKQNALLYGFFIILIFVVFGLVLSLIFGASLGNVLSTHWIPNLLFAVIFLIFAFSMLGYFEITLPSSWVNGSAKRQRSGGLIGIFFMALTLVLVSFSCTLPIAGAVALGAAGGSFLKPVIGMLGFSLGIAVPFTFFALCPGVISKLPKSGSWMNTLKVVLAFIELAFALKFINVPDQTYHWGILDREVYLALWIVLFSLLGLYLMGKIRFPLDDEYPVQKSAFRFTLSVLVFAFVVYMIPGMFGAPLKAISGWLPPMTTQDFDISNIVRTESGNGNATASTFQWTEEPLYADKLEIPFGIKGYFDYDQALRVAKKEGKPVFLDFTGHGCTNCRNVENAVWIDPEVRRIFAEEVIVCTMYADDKVIPLPAEEQGKLSDADGEPITMLGAKNRYIEQNKYHENSQPCYFIVDPDGNVLSGPTYYERDKDNYIKFLRAGIDKFKNQ